MLLTYETLLAKAPLHELEEYVATNIDTVRQLMCTPNVLYIYYALNPKELDLPTYITGVNLAYHYFSELKVKGFVLCEKPKKVYTLLKQVDWFSGMYFVAEGGAVALPATEAKQPIDLDNLFEDEL